MRIVFVTLFAACLLLADAVTVKETKKIVALGKDSKTIGSMIEIRSCDGKRSNSYPADSHSLVRGNDCTDTMRIAEQLGLDCGNFVTGADAVCIVADSTILTRYFAKQIVAKGAKVRVEWKPEVVLMRAEGMVVEIKK